LRAYHNALDSYYAYCPVHRYAGKDNNYILEKRKQFSILVATLMGQGIVAPEKLPALQFWALIEKLEKDNKAQKSIKNERIHRF